MSNSAKEDLIVLVADMDIENTFMGLLPRHHALGCRSFSHKIVRHPGRDSGTRKECVEFLRPFASTHEHAIVVFDHEGSGRENTPAALVEDEIQKLLSRNGWNDRSCVLVLEPEIESWVWSDSPHVLRGLGWNRSFKALKDFVESKNSEWWDTDAPKPKRPKEVMETVLRKQCRPRSASIFKKLATTVGVKGCSDRTFAKLKAALANWFPVP